MFNENLWKSMKWNTVDSNRITKWWPFYNQCKKEPTVYIVLNWLFMQITIHIIIIQNVLFRYIVFCWTSSNLTNDIEYCPTSSFTHASWHSNNLQEHRFLVCWVIEVLHHWPAQLYVVLREVMMEHTPGPAEEQGRGCRYWGSILILISNGTN